MNSLVDWELITYKYLEAIEDLLDEYNNYHGFKGFGGIKQEVDVELDKLKLKIGERLIYEFLRKEEENE